MGDEDNPGNNPKLAVIEEVGVDLSKVFDCNIG